MRALLYTPTMHGPMINEVEIDDNLSASLNQICQYIGCRFTETVRIDQDSNGLYHTGFIGEGSLTTVPEGANSFLTKFTFHTDPLCGRMVVVFIDEYGDNAPVTMTKKAFAEMIEELSVRVPKDPL